MDFFGRLLGEALEFLGDIFIFRAMRKTRGHDDDTWSENAATMVGIEVKITVMAVIAVAVMVVLALATDWPLKWVVGLPMAAVAVIGLVIYFRALDR